MWSKSKPGVKFQYGGRLAEFNGMSQSHVSHCRVLPRGEFTVTIPEPHATLPGVRIQSAMLKIVFCHILFIYFLFFNAVWGLTSGSFCIISDTLVVIVSVDLFGDVDMSCALHNQ